MKVQQDPMKRKTQSALAVVLGLLFTGLAQAQSSHLITTNSAGPVKLGMTVAQVRRAVRPMKLSRTSDGDGVALIAVKSGKIEIMTLFAGEEDQNAPIKETAKVELIQVWSPGFATQNGVHVGMSLRTAEKKFGRVTQIMMSEIEQREYATFANQPKNLNFRVEVEGSTAGIYASGKNTTTRFKSATKIMVIEISKR
jgi:hypothetical protein